MKFRTLSSTRQRTFGRGVTLVELMVGMAIGLLSVVVITQVMVQAEGQKRSTTSGSDAQVNGALAVDMLQREIRSSGFGLIAESHGIGCKIVGNRLGKLLEPADAWVLAPVILVDGKDGAPDQIRVLRSDQRRPTGTLKSLEFHSQTGREFTMVNDMTPYVSVGDLLLAVPPPLEPAEVTKGVVRNCTLFSATAVATNVITHNPDSAAGAWNAVPSNFPADTYPPKTVVVNTGRFVNRNYSIVDGQLMRTAFSSATGGFDAAEAMFPQIVNLQAVYGKSTKLDGQPTLWNADTPKTADDWANVYAIRLALVSRSAQRETDEVTTVAPQWKPDGTTAESIVLESDADWKHYRYKVYEVVVPLRNRLWHNATAADVKESK